MNHFALQWTLVDSSDHGSEDPISCSIKVYCAPIIRIKDCKVLKGCRWCPLPSDLAVGGAYAVDIKIIKNILN